MSRIEEILTELNKVYKRRGWKLLSMDNEFKYKNDIWVIVYNDDILYIIRNHIPYNKHLNDFTIEELDEYVMEYIKHVCIKYGIISIWFLDSYDLYNRKNKNIIKIY